MTGSAEERPHIVEIRAPKGATVMELDWSDGAGFRVTHEILRGFCPCAHCQGHQGPIRFVTGGDLVLRDIEEVGQYALRLIWNDGHQTGIYTYVHLRALCEASERESPTTQTFSR